MKNSDNPRARAVQVLKRWEKSRLPAERLLNEVLKEPFADRRDEQLCRAITLGVIRWLGFLDWVLGKFSKHPLVGMKPLTRQGRMIYRRRKRHNSERSSSIAGKTIFGRSTPTSKCRTLGIFR